MSLRYGRKISELNLLTASSAETYVLGIDGDTSYKLPAIVFQTAVSETSLGVVNGRLNNLEGATGSYLTHLPSGVLSSSAQVIGFETTGRGILSGSISYHSLTNRIPYVATLFSLPTKKYRPASKLLMSNLYILFSNVTILFEISCWVCDPNPVIIRFLFSLLKPLTAVT